MSRKPLGGFGYQPQSLYGWVRIPFTSKVITCRLFETEGGAFSRWEKAAEPQFRAANQAMLERQRVHAERLFRETNEAREQQLADAWAARQALASPSSRQAGPASLTIGYQPGPEPASAAEQGLASHDAPVPEWQLIRAAEASAREAGMRASMPDPAAAGTPEYDADLARWGDGRGIGPDGPETVPAAETADTGIEALAEMSGLIIIGQQAAADRATDEATVTALQRAMAVISAVCDYAQELDARGFSAADAWLGHVLAQMSPGLWSDPVALTAWDMLRKYRGQLAAAGIDYDQLPRPAGAGELEAGRREQAREHARGHAQAWREQQYRQTYSYVRCDGDGDGDRVVLAFPYDPDLVAACRKIDGRSYDGATRTNVFPFTSLPAVLDLAARHGIEVTADVRALAGIATRRVAQRAALPQVRMDEDDGTIVIDASLDAALYEKVKELDGRWDSAAKVHRVPGHRAPELANLADQHSLRVSDQVRQSAADTSATQDKNRKAAGAFEADPVPVPGLATGRSLKPQQYPVVRFALNHRRVLIGDDMGWGKTLSSLAAVAADRAYPAVVVCRPSLTLNWAAEIRRFFPDLVIEQAQGTTAQPVPGGADVIIIGSAALAAKPRKSSDGGKEFGWVEELKKAGPKALIIDEGQDTKERAANRSQACEQLAASVIARDGLVLDLTGTAILNRPRELCQQLTILGRIAEFGGPKAFLWRYCLSETNQWGASYDGARNLIELHDRLRSWGIMIRRSDDSALGLPPCREHVLCVPQTELDTAVMNRYRQAEADLLGFLAGKARQTAARLGKDPDSAAVAAAMRASAAEHLVAINTLRQLAGQAKRGYVTGWVRQHVTAGEKVMVAAHHREEVDAYAAAFGGLKLQGGQPVAEKEAVKARFQQQPASHAPVIAVAIGAGGVGHTLTAAAIGIQAEQAWTPGETQQMKKRLHRIGQEREVDYYVTVAEGTIDEHLWAVVTAKQATLDAVLDGRSDTGAAADDRSVAAELTWRLTQQGLGTCGPASPAPGDIAEDARVECATRPDDDAAAGSRARMISSARDEAALAAMRADAEANSSPFTDPAVLRKAEVVLAGIDAGWLERVVGHPVASWRYLNHGELLLAVRAAEADAGHLGALAAAQRAAAALERQAAAAVAQAKTWAAAARWQRLREQLPVPVTVQHNWTARHLEGYEQGADHIVVLADLEADRFRRAAGTPLCQTASRTHQLRHVHGSIGDERRLPDCKACLRLAGKLAATAAGSGGAMEPGTNQGDGGNLPVAHASPRAADGDDETPAQAPAPGQELREAAHRYLENGLLPVPAWAARQNGECCCPRGADCDRPGKHPRSVRTGPGSRDYSWKPLACRTHAEIDQRFAAAGVYAAGNLMVAIPGEMMAIDRDDDDGGRAAVEDLAGELGELPPTLAHRTPHGEHLIYRTPPGWKGRAWVGKDPGNPVPPGVDLRMPGQILMAAPSAVPSPDGPARYGPTTGDHVAALPARYVTAWTPPQPQPRPAGPRVPVPPEGADRAARYVHDAMTGIAEDLASRQPGGRNAAAYAAGLKAGSLLGAARATPGAEQAAAAWTDEAAEEALMDAAERNGYTGKDGQAEARRAIRSGLRNGLRNPRALPDFTTTGPATGHKQPPRRPAPSGPARPQGGQAAVTRGRQAGRWQDMVPDDIRRQIQAADRGASNRRRATTAAHQQAMERHSQSPTADTATEVERTRSAADAAHQAYLRDGRHVTGRHDAAMLRWAAAIIARREQSAERPAPAADSARMQANRAAVAANEAYKAGDLDQARELTDQAAALDPSRAGLWQQHRNDIAARRLILSARSAHADGDHERAGKLLKDARQLDPRLRTLWDSSLSAQPAARITRQASRHNTAAPGPGGTARTNRSAPPPARSQQRQPAGTRQPGQETPQPAWPSAPARREPGRPAPAAPQPGAAPSSSQQSATAAAPREPRATASADAEDPDPDAGEDPARWPSPNPRTQAQATRIRQDGHDTATNPPAPPQRGSRTATPDQAPAADWRDQILSDARQPWAPGPSWPHHPSLSRVPQTDTPEAGIEPGR